MSRIFTLGSHAIALHSFYQYHRRFNFGSTGTGKGSKDLLLVLTSPLNAPNFLVGKGIHHLLKLGIPLYPVLSLHITGQD